MIEAFCEHLSLEPQLARQTPPAFLVAFGLMAEFVTKADGSNQTFDVSRPAR